MPNTKSRTNLLNDINQKSVGSQLVLLSLVSPLIAGILCWVIQSVKMDPTRFFTFALVLLITGMWSLLVGIMLWHTGKQLNLPKYRYLYFLSAVNFLSTATPFFYFSNR